MTEDDPTPEAIAHPLTRTQKRLLRRIYNGRTTAIVVDDRPFLSYKEALRHLQSLAPEEREASYARMKLLGERRGTATLSPAIVSPESPQ
ncbi:MAG: hypothetical protein ABW192_00805 [Sphingobium sp.]